MSKSTAPSEPPAKSSTHWSAFAQAHLVPVWVMCEGYQPVHRRNEGCHTKLSLKPIQDTPLDGGGVHPGLISTLVRHIDSHAGGIQMKLRPGDKDWKGWVALEEAGIEARDFRCEVCDKAIPFHPRHILSHMAPHPGKVKRTFADYCALFNLTLTGASVPPTEDEAFEDFG